MVLSSEFFPSPRAGASGMMEMTPARVQNQGFRQIVGHRLSPTVLEDHPWIRWLGSAGLDQNEVDAPAARTGKSASLVSASVRDAIGSQVGSKGWLGSYWNCGKRVLQNSPRPLIPKPLSRIGFVVRRDKPA